MLSLANWLSRSSTSGHSGYGFYVCGLTFHWTFVSLAVPLTLMCFTGWVWPVPLMLCFIGCDLFHWSFHVFLLWPVPIMLLCFVGCDLFHWNCHVTSTNLVGLPALSIICHKMVVIWIQQRKEILKVTTENSSLSSPNDYMAIFWLYLKIAGNHRAWGVGGGGDLGTCTLWVSLSCTFLQTLPDLVMPLKGHSLSST